MGAIKLGESNMMGELNDTLTGVRSRQMHREPSCKTNPSKRHRERLNSELDHIASLLPFDDDVIAKLDKLSILRLSVSFLRIKGYFNAIFNNTRPPYGHTLRDGYDSSAGSNSLAPCKASAARDNPSIFCESEVLEKAINGFMFVVSCDGEVFFVSKSVEHYLGFQQCDIIHQSVMELIHSQDREDFRRQLAFSTTLRSSGLAASSDLVNPLTAQLASHFPADSMLAMDRSFTVRFRCLLDNTSGFVTLEITGRILPIYGQPEMPEGCGNGFQSNYALFATCCPFGPLPLLELHSQKSAFKTRHSMDISPIALDQKAKEILGYNSDEEFAQYSGYQLIHPADVLYYATAHQEVVKTGSCGMVAYRMRHADQKTWLWLQTGARVIYKTAKPDCIICRHKQLKDDEGESLLHKRFVEFKLPYPLLESDSLQTDESPSVCDSNTEPPNAIGACSETTPTKKRKTTNKKAGSGSGEEAIGRKLDGGGTTREGEEAHWTSSELYYELYGEEAAQQASYAAAYGADSSLAPGYYGYQTATPFGDAGYYQTSYPMGLKTANAYQPTMTSLELQEWYRYQRLTASTKATAAGMAAPYGQLYYPGMTQAAHPAVGYDPKSAPHSPAYGAHFGARPARLSPTARSASRSSCSSGGTIAAGDYHWLINSSPTTNQIAADNQLHSSHQYPRAANFYNINMERLAATCYRQQTNAAVKQLGAGSMYPGAMDTQYTTAEMAFGQTGYDMARNFPLAEVAHTLLSVE